jgi:hypothetical protein
MIIKPRKLCLVTALDQESACLSDEEDFWRVGLVRRAKETEDS